jgi:hypothetical protein
VTLEIVSEENFSKLAGTINAIRDGEMEVCYGLLGRLDEDALERLRVLEGHHGEYLDTLEEVSVDEDESRIRATFVTGSDGEDFLRELLMVFGPCSDLARGKVTDLDSGAGGVEASDPDDDDDSFLDDDEGFEDDDDDEDEEDPFENSEGSQLVYDKGRVIDNS